MDIYDINLTDNIMRMSSPQGSGFIPESRAPPLPAIDIYDISLTDNIMKMSSSKGSGFIPESRSPPLPAKDIYDYEEVKPPGVLLHP